MLLVSGIQSKEAIVGDNSRNHCIEAELHPACNPITWKNGDPPCCRELVLYSILQTSFPTNSFRARDAALLAFERAVNGANRILNCKDQLSPSQVTSYLKRAPTKSTNSGKYRGRVRWARFSDLVSKIIQGHGGTLHHALKNCMIEADRSALLRDIDLALASWEFAPNQTADHKPFGLSEISEFFYSHASTFSLWRLDNEGNEGLHLFYFGGSPAHAVRSIRILPNLSFSTFMYGIQVPLQLDVSDNVVSSADHFSKLLHMLATASECSGCSYNKYEKVVETRPEGGIFRGSDGTVVANLEEAWVPQRCIRTVVCPHLIAAGSRCAACKLFDGTLRKALSRLSDTPVSPHTAFIHLSRDDLILRLRSEAKRFEELSRNFHRLQKMRDEMISSVDDGFSEVFKNLQDGMDIIHDRVQNPICMWEGCKRHFSEIKDLVHHLKFDHVRNSALQLHPSYTCKWKDCKSGPFRSRKLCETHLLLHTGKPEDAFFSLLLADQARALVTPSHQMRWHPSVLRWCMQQHALSAQSYESMRESGFLKLPSGRTILRYRNFNQPQSGWHEHSLRNMRESYDEFLRQGKGRHDRAFMGGLYFDEVKVKEGLVWDERSDTLVGFVDSGCYPDSEEGEVEDLLATHVLQFSFKSLFSKFFFPCCYFFTKSMKGYQLEDVIDAGVSSLHRFGFDVLVLCCDGGGSNRGFLRSFQDSSGAYYNKKSLHPIFVISDPTHIVKKFRNNLSKSGQGASFTRHLQVEGYSIVWKQIREVNERGSQRQVGLTRITKEHVNLSSYSKMRAGLAFDVFQQCVIDEMQTSDPAGTVGVRKYLENVKMFVDIFSSSTKLVDPSDPRLVKLASVSQWLNDWKSNAGSSGGSKSFVSPQLHEDVTFAAQGLQSLVAFIATEFHSLEPPLYVIPKTINQDFLEGYFGLQRSIGGCNSNMTCKAYGYNGLCLNQTHVMGRNLGTGAAQMPLKPHHARTVATSKDSHQKQ